MIPKRQGRRSAGEAKGECGNACSISALEMIINMKPNEANGGPKEARRKAVSHVPSYAIGPTIYHWLARRCSPTQIYSFCFQIGVFIFGAPLQLV